jgi:hypothetical protein
VAEDPEIGLLVAAFDRHNREMTDALTSLAAGRSNPDPDAMNRLVAAAKDTRGAYVAIHKWLSARAVATVPPVLRQRLRDLRNGPPGLYAQVVAAIGLPPEPEDSEAFADDGWLKPLIDSFFEDVLPARAARVRAALAGDRIPAHVSRHAVTLRQTFILGFYDAQVVFARTLIETALFEFLRRKRQIAPHQQLRSTEEFDNLKDLIERAKPHLPRATVDAMNELRMAGNRVLHAKQDVPSMSEDEALSLLRKSYGVIERLFTN